MPTLNAFSRSGRSSVISSTPWAGRVTTSPVHPSSLMPPLLGRLPADVRATTTSGCRCRAGAAEADGQVARPAHLTARPGDGIRVGQLELRDHGEELLDGDLHLHPG